MAHLGPTGQGTVGWGGGRPGPGVFTSVVCGWQGVVTPLAVERLVWARGAGLRGRASCLLACLEKPALVLQCSCRLCGFGGEGSPRPAHPAVHSLLGPFRGAVCGNLNNHHSSHTWGLDGESRVLLQGLVPVCLFRTEPPSFQGRKSFHLWLLWTATVSQQGAYFLCENSNPWYVKD